MHHHGLLHEPEFWVLVSFVLFFVLFGKRIWTAITGLLDGRANAIRAELAEARKLREEAESMLADAQRAKEAALAEAGAMLARSREEADRIKAQAITDAEATAKRRERLALDRIAAAEKAAIAEMRNAATDVAIRAAEHVIKADSETHDAEIVDAAIADLPRALRAA